MGRTHFLKSQPLRFSILNLTLAAILVSTYSLPLRADEYWDQKTSLFEILPIKKSDIVFLGNSITDGGEFNELFNMANIKNRGIRSDQITGVEKRITQVTSGYPAKIFLLIGINDVAQGLSIDRIAERYERLVKKIREQSPDTKLYVQSVMPINNDFNRYKTLSGKEAVVRGLNDRIKKIAASEGAEYIDLWPTLADANGKLKRAFTNDGLHLNGVGYRAWTRAIENKVKE